MTDFDDIAELNSSDRILQLQIAAADALADYKLSQSARNSRADWTPVAIVVQTDFIECECGAKHTGFVNCFVEFTSSLGKRLRAVRPINAPRNLPRRSEYQVQTVEQCFECIEELLS
jgi:hypothetical protein